MKQLRVVNADRGAVLGTRVALADRWLARLRGLLGRPELEPGEGLLLVPITLSPNLQGQNRAAWNRVNVHDKQVVLPPKENTYGSIEGLMNHFMLIMEGYGIRPPMGEAYFATEGANGELGFYVVSDGGDRPYRVRCRPPCLPPLAALHRMIEGEQIADLIPTFGSVNMIGGELDR